MNVRKALKVLEKKGITSRAIAKFMKVKLDNEIMFNCVVAYDDEYFYIFNENLLGLGNSTIIIERKDNSYEVRFNDNIVGKILLYEFKFILNINKRVLILEDAIEGEVNKFFEEFGLRGVGIANVTKSKFYLKKGIKYGSYLTGGVAMAIGGSFVWDYLEEMFEEKIKEVVENSSEEIASKIADSFIDKINPFS
jgi:hypothetical protein